MFGRLKRALAMYRLFGRCEDALKTGLEAPMGKTKWGSLLAGIGTLVLITAQVMNGSMDLGTAIPAAITAIGAVIAVFGGRDAIDKVAGKIADATKDK